MRTCAGLSITEAQAPQAGSRWGTLTLSDYLLVRTEDAALRVLRPVTWTDIVKEAEPKRIQPSQKIVAEITPETILAY